MNEIILQKLDTNLLKEHLATASQEIQKAKSSTEINAIAERVVCSVLGSEYASMWFYDSQKAVLSRERNEGEIKEVSLKEKQGILYKCFLLQNERIYNYLASEKDYVPLIDNVDKIQMKSKIMIPLLENETLVGILTAYSSVKNIRNFTEDDLDVLKAISPYIINILSKIHPENFVKDEIKYERRVDFTKRAEVDTLEEVQRIEKSRESRESPDETLAFMANAVHDMRTPANNLFGFLELLEEQISDVRLKTYLKNAKESAGYINELSTSILDRISSQRERVIAETEEVSAAKFFSDISESFISNMYAKKIKFNVFIDPQLPKEIEVNTLKLKRVIINILGNAYKFTPNNGRIEFHVRYQKKEKCMKISVKDSGIGIQTDKQEEIFRAFEQANETIAEEYGGTGLGLAICAGYVKDFGGELKLESELGKGSKFYFEMPLLKTNKRPSFSKINSSSISIAILMSEENSFTANNIAKYFARMGIDKSRVSAISSTSAYPKGMTHLVSFQNKTDDSIITNAIAKNVKTLIVEENLFSINKNEIHDSSKVISQYGYYANTLHAFVDTHDIPKVLIVDDDKASVLLVKLILEGEFCEVVVAKDGQRALDSLINAQKMNKPFALAFLDNKVPIIYGSEVMKKFRTYEQDNGLKPIYAVSISGDMLKNSENKEFFDIHIGKPFKKADIRQSLHSIC